MRLRYIVENICSLAILAAVAVYFGKWWIILFYPLVMNYPKS